MKKTYSFFKLQIFTLLILTSTALNAQVGIGTTSPSGGALLDLTSADKGFLVPRVDINDLTDIVPVTGGATIGLLVWNTEISTGVGFHYWDGNDWVPLGGSSGGNHWDLAGNTITGSEILGTISTHDLNIRTDNVDRMRVQSNGQVTVGFGAALGNTDQQFNSVGTATNGVGVGGYSGGTGMGVYGQNIAGGNGVLGLNNSTGNGVFGYNNNSGDAIHAEHDGSGDGVNSVNYGTGVGVYGENFSFTNYSIHAVDGIASVYGDNTAFGFDGVVGLTDDTVSNGIWGINNNTSGTAILGGVNGVHIYPTGGTGISGSGPTLGVYGYAGEGDDTPANEGNAAGSFVLDTDSDVSTTSAATGTRASALLAGYDNLSPNGILGADEVYFGGYFTGGTAGISYAYAGVKYNPNNTSGGGGGGTNYKIIGNGTNSTIIRDKTNTPRILFSPEAPEILFEDYGTGKLLNGQVDIILDPIFKDAIYVDERHPLKVFIQLEGDCNGVYVTNKSANGFTVKELQSGNSNVAFSWHIVANRANDVDENGNIQSEHVGLRFPVGPEPAKQKEMKSRKEIILSEAYKKAPKKEQESDVSKKVIVPERIKKTKSKD